MRRLIFVSAAVAGLLAACSPQKVVHDKPYYAAQEMERTKEIAACRDDPGEAITDPNCINATAAQAEIDRKKFYDVTPPASRLSDPGKL